MKKYLQITVVLGLFFSLVIFKSLFKGDEGENVQVGNSNQIQQTQTSTTDTTQPATTPDTSSQQNSNNSMMSSGGMMAQYKDGSYTGSSEDAFYGNIQVKAIISGGKITDVIFLDYPQDNRTSLSINSQAQPMLKAEAISKQSANVEIISGASYSSMAFQKSLANALSQANN